MRPSRTQRVIACLVYPDSYALDVVAMVSPFTTANHLICNPGPYPVYQWATDHGPYSIVFLSKRGGQVSTVEGMRFVTHSLRSKQARTIDTLIVPGGFGVVHALRDKDLVSSAEKLEANARRVCAVGSGLALVAKIGNLNQGSAVARSDYANDLTRYYPKLALNTHSLFVREGKFWSSAGAASCLDLALWLIEDDLGRAMALKVAKRLIVYSRRLGDEPQFSLSLGAMTRFSDKFEKLHAFIRNHLASDLSLAEMARHMGMSVRNFSRRYMETFGRTPAQQVEMIRVQEAKRYMASTDLSFREAARLVGFGSEQRMRRAFARQAERAPSKKQRRTRNVGPERL